MNSENTQNAENIEKTENIENTQNKVILEKPKKKLI